MLLISSGHIPHGRIQVGEHLPTWCLANYLALLHRSNRRGLILSWSALSQGTCHINEKSTSVVANYVMALGGYRLDDIKFCSRQVAAYPWLRRTMVFQRINTTATGSECAVPELPTATMGGDAEDAA